MKVFIQRRSKISATFLGLVLGAFCSFQQCRAALDYGIFKTFIVLNANGSGNVFYDALANTGNPDFQGANLGSFNPVFNSLILNGGEVNTFKHSPGDVTGAFLDYRVWTTGNPAGSFIERTVPFTSNDPNGVDQKWSMIADNRNVLSGLANDNYTLEIYFRASGNQGDVFDNRGGPNYQATFSVVPEPTNTALGMFGALAAAGFVVRKYRRLRSKKFTPLL